MIFQKVRVCSYKPWLQRSAALDTGLMVLPVFYDVDPSDVRKQTSTFEKSFVEHEESFKENIKKVETWRAALREVTNLSSWHLQDR